MISFDSQLTEEEFNLYNPAYCGFLLYSLIRSHEENSGRGIHCGLIYLMLPLILTKEILISLPRSSQSSFVAWVTENEGMLIDFPLRAESFFYISQTAQNFLIESKLISISKDGYVNIIKKDLPKFPSLFNKSLYMKAQLTASKLLGKWISVSPSVETVYSVLGMRP